MSEWNPPSSELSRPPRPGKQFHAAGAALLGVAALGAAVLWMGGRPRREGPPAGSAELVRPLGARLAKGLVRSPAAPTMDEVALMEALGRDRRFRKVLYLDRVLTVRWGAEPWLLGRRFEKPDGAGFPDPRGLLAALEKRRPELRRREEGLEELVYPLTVGEEVVGVLCLALQIDAATGPIAVPEALEAGRAPSVSTAPLAIEDLPRAEEERRELGRQYYIEGLSHYARGAFAKARGAWEVARGLDPSNQEILLALRKLDREMPDASRPASERLRLAQQHYLEGVLYFQKRQYAQARFEWALARELEPDNPDVAVGLRRVEELLGGRNAP